MEPAAEQSRSGVAQTGVIDFFAHDTRADELLLAMFEARPWDDSDLQLFQLQEKFNAYVSFLLDGELAEAHPELTGKNARIELRCATMPEGRALDLLSAIHDQLALQEIRLEVIAGNEGGGCDGDCSCH
ncbi:MAG: hypothetical protein H0X34_00580 [Chthoniobacterales bacterium]|nr:hypothetical protein [Chthoniobacterales bacterium]